MQHEALGVKEDPAPRPAGGGQASPSYSFKLTLAVLGTAESECQDLLKDAVDASSAALPGV